MVCYYCGGIMKECYKFFQNQLCKYFPWDNNEEACHPESNPKIHNCLFCYCPLYALDPRDCPEEANPNVLEDGAKDCSDCIFPHDPNNYQDMLEMIKKEIIKPPKYL